MPLTNTQLRYYDSSILRLDAETRKSYHAQVDRLVDELRANIRDKTTIKVTKVFKAGSFAKYTILQRTAIDPVDVDVIFYISGESVDSATLASLSDKIFELLVAQYPTKSVADFELQRKAATVNFIRSGLSVDIVPVIEIPDRPGYGWQYDITDGSRMLTCPPGQIQFVRDRKREDADFRTLVRMAKKWRNYAEVKPLKSFAIELIMAHVIAVRGSGGSIEQRFRNFLLYIAQTGLKEQISFPENQPPFQSFADPVVVLDPVYSLNNVTSRISESERQAIVKAAEEAWYTAQFASAENDNDVWKELFGKKFKVEA